MKISEVAKVTDTAIETIRYYEREGLISTAQRQANNYRYYDEVHVQQLSFIRHCRSLDMSLDEIRLLQQFKTNPKENCSEVNHVIDNHIQHVRDRIESLLKLEAQLTQLRAQCIAEGGNCAILEHLEQSGTKFDARPTDACLRSVKHCT